MNRHGLGCATESGQLARKLVENGFTKVTVLDEGFKVWQGRKYPTSAFDDEPVRVTGDHGEMALGDGFMSSE